MSIRPKLDGAGSLDPDASRDAALAALARRVAELEHRLNTMKIIVGLVLTGKVALVAFVFYVVFGGGFVARSGGPTRPTSQPVEFVRPAGSARRA